MGHIIDTSSTQCISWICLKKYGVGKLMESITEIQIERTDANCSNDRLCLEKYALKLMERVTQRFRLREWTLVAAFLEPSIHYRMSSR